MTSLGTLADKITTTTWKVGGGTSENLMDVPSTAYQYEVGSNALTTTYDAKIGLMYVSDYGFAADPNAWTTKLSSYSSSSKDWLSLSSKEWTISPKDSSAGSGLTAYAVSSAGSVVYEAINRSTSRNDSGFDVRPSFFLFSTVAYASGTGTPSDPIRLS